MQIALCPIHYKKKLASDTQNSCWHIICKMFSAIMEKSCKRIHMCTYHCVFLSREQKKIKFTSSVSLCDRDKYFTTVVICSGKIHWWIEFTYSNRFSFNTLFRLRVFFLLLLQNFVDVSLSDGFATVSTWQASLCSTDCQL